MSKFYVYRFLDSQGDVLYVGRTEDLIGRLRGHKHLPQECYNQVREIEYIELANGADMSLYEIYYINKYQPRYNTDSKYPNGTAELTEHTWKNFREFFEGAQEDTLEDISWKSYKREILDIAIEQEKGLKDKRLEIKAKLLAVNQAVEIIDGIIRDSGESQIPFDNETLLDYLNMDSRDSSNDMLYTIVCENDGEFSKGVEALRILQKNAFLKVRDDGRDKEFCILSEVLVDKEGKKLGIYINADYVCLLNIWSRQIVSGNIKLLNSLKAINSNLEVLRNKLGKLYKRSDNDLDYLTKIFKEDA